jgi:putative exosortase-associated protein (TIGR04073 family)
MKASIVVSAALLCLALMGAFCSPAFAAGSFKTVENSSPQEIMGGMGTKMVRGIANIATGSGEFPKQIYLTAKDDGAAQGIFVGPFKGIGMTVVRTVTGVAELATFFIPSPGFYSPYFDPGFVWQKE